MLDFILKLRAMDNIPCYLVEQLTKKSSSSTVKCPECRRVYRVPPDGFQVCRLSLAVREHIECALKKESVTQTNDVLPPQTLSLTNPEKKLNGDYSSNKTAGRYMQVHRNILFKMSQLKNQQCFVAKLTPIRPIFRLLDIFYFS